MSWLPQGCREVLVRLMTNLVPTDQIEAIVGARRHADRHIARADTAEQMVYILHSHECRDSGIDLRDCEFSIALDAGINPPQWRTAEAEDIPVYVEVLRGRLVPVGRADHMNQHVAELRAAVNKEASHG